MVINSKLLPNITSIRFFLALLVMLFHIPQFSENRRFPFYNDLPIFHKGIEAVYLFFSLSGFLIIKQLYNEKRYTHSINLKAFYFRRMLRIFPLYYLILGIGFAYYRFVLPFFGYDFQADYDLMSGLLLTVTFFPNIFSTYAPGGILEILWSIGVEEQFYLLIAPLFSFVPLNRILTILGVFTVVFFLLFFSDFGVFFKKYNMLYFYFSFSGLCSIVCGHKIVQTFLEKGRFLILVLAVLYFTTSIFKSNLTLPQYHIFSFVLFGATLSVLSKKPIKILQNKTINYLGKISYGLYMYHPIVLQLVGFLYLKVVSKWHFYKTVDVIIINLATITTTIVLSHVSFKYYERYFLRMKAMPGIRRIKNN